MRMRHRVEANTIAREPRRRRLGPGLIAQGTAADLDRRAGDGPWTGHRGKPVDVGGMTDGEAEPQAGQAIKLSERPQHQESRSIRLGCKRQLRIGIGKALVDDETADAREQCEQVLRRMTSTVGIVGIDDDGEIRTRQRIELRNLLDVPARGGQDARIFIVGRPENTRPPGRRELRQQLNGALCTADRNNRCVRAVGLLRRPMQCLDLGARRQRSPRARAHLAHGIGHPVDPGRQINPIFSASAKTLLGQVQISTVLAHAPLFHAKARIASTPATSSMARR
ncbi:hypothetical protein ABIA40_003350 [Bradyrhizobium sp. USDA 223]